MGSGDIKVVAIQGKESTLKHINSEDIDERKYTIETKIQCVLVSLETRSSPVKVE